MKVDPRRKTLSNWDHVAICFSIVCFQRLCRGKCAFDYCGALYSRLVSSKLPVLFLINILLWWVTLPFIYRQLLPNNVFFLLLLLPLNGEQPILSRMLMPCKSRSEARLRGNKLPSILLGERY